MAITFIPGHVFYMLNLRTNRMLSFGGIETAASEIFNIQSTKKPPELIIVKKGPDSKTFVDIKLVMTAKMIEEALKTA